MATNETDKDARLWGMLCHLSALLMVIPFAHIIGPLLVWLIKKNDYPFVDEQGKEALNFQISMTIYGFVAFLLMVVAIGFVLMPLLFIADIVLVIIAGVKANNGECYRYPLTIRLIK